MRTGTRLTRFRWLMGCFSLAFLLTGLAFALWPSQILQMANRAGAWFHFGPAAPDPHRFWVALTVSMMAAITVSSWLLYRDPVGNRSQIWPMLAAKLTSSFWGLYFFFFYSQAFVHLLIPLVDLPIALVIWGAYRQAGLARAPDG